MVSNVRRRQRPLDIHELPKRVCDMKAMVMEQVGKPMVVKDWPEPKCPADGAVVRVEASGICRSDWHLWQGDWGWIGFKPRLPTVLGHEFAGVIEEVGSDVKSLKPGARVVV